MEITKTITALVRMQSLWGQEDISDEQEVDGILAKMCCSSVVGSEVA